MNKREELNAALKEALKAKDQIALSTIRLMMAALKDRDISVRGKGNTDGVGEPEILSMLQSMIKQRQESSNTYADAGRDDLAEREMDEIAVIKRFLPEQMNEAEVSKIIEELISETGASNIKDMGKVMGELKARYAGQLDMGKAGGVVKQKLSA